MTDSTKDAYYQSIKKYDGSEPTYFQEFIAAVPLPYGAYNRPVTALYSAITAIFGLISGLRPRLIYIDRSGTPAAAPHKTGLL